MLEFWLMFHEMIVLTRYDSICRRGSNLGNRYKDLEELQKAYWFEGISLISSNKLQKWLVFTQIVIIILPPTVRGLPMVAVSSNALIIFWGVCVVESLSLGQFEILAIIDRNYRDTAQLTPNLRV
jgi:hypothetical protein